MKNLFRKILSKAKSIASNERVRALFLYFVVYLLLFFPIRHGAGQFWDWTFPYFKEHMPNFFWNRSLSWGELDFGKPLDYSTDYILRFLVSLFFFINPETFRYLLYTLIFAMSSLGVYLISRKKLNPQWAFFLGLAALVNPATLYKFVAGHFNYFVSFLIFIYFVYYVLFKFKANMRSAVIVGLALAFIGIQIQFFVISFLFLALFFLFERKKFKVRYLAVICLIVFSINLIWLSNFIFGGTEVAKFSSDAAKVSFASSKQTDLFNIFSFSFSKATLIGKLYENRYLIFFILFYLLLFSFMLKNRAKDKINIFFLAFLMILTFLSTGAYNSFPIWPISVIYPMFREVGHFAPLVVLTLVLLIGRMVKDNKILNISLFCFVLAFIAINAYKFYQYSPSLNFGDIRRSFGSFEKLNEWDDSTYRVLTYPFFDQYSFKDKPLKEVDNSPTGNSGHDSFITYSGEDYVDNIIPPYDFKNSLQYQLLKTGDVGILRPYNIKYIFNFSNIYESNYDKYVPGYIYDNNASLIKNNEGFFDELIFRNPDKLLKINDNILEIKDFLPRVYAADNIFGFSSAGDLGPKMKFISGVLGKDPNYVITDDAKNTPLTSISSLFDNISEESLDYSQKAVLDKSASLNKEAALYINDSKAEIYFREDGGKLAFYKKTPSELSLNGALIGSEKTETVQEIELSQDKKYYVGSGTELLAVQDGKEEGMGMINRDMAIKLYSVGDQNLIPDAAFQEGLWDKEVGDCNNYDDNPLLDMKLGQKDRSTNNFLQLEAIRHVACTTNTFNVEENKDYLFSFDYQSPNAKTAGYYLEFNDAAKTVVREQVFISDGDWHNYARRIEVPSGATSARLYLYAYSTDEKTDIINRYGNFSLVGLDPENEVDLEYKPSFEKEKVDLADSNVFQYADPNYDYSNIIPNGSFEEGLWEGKVGDCDNYDDNPEIGMNLSDKDSSDGAKSLELEATRHNACTDVAFPVREYGNYLFSFDYQSPNAKTAGYYLEFNDGLKTVYSEVLDIKDKNWHKFIKTIKAPAGATSARLYVYAYESDESTVMIDHYDNFKFIGLPDLEDKYYLVSDPGASLKNPANVDFERMDSTKRIIHVKSASAPFYLVMSEGYHQKWQLEMNDGKVQGLLSSAFPFAHPDKIPDEDHLKLDDSLNAWYVDVNDFCKNRNLCHENPDGSYDMELVAEFTPQRWFNVSLLVSISTLLISLGYLVWSWKRRK